MTSSPLSFLAPSRKVPLALRSNCFPSHWEDQHAEEEEEDDEDENNPPRKYPRYHRRKHDANTTPKRNANANPRDDGDEDASLRLLFIFLNYAGFF